MPISASSDSLLLSRRKLLAMASVGAASATLSGCMSVPREATPQAYVEPRQDFGYYSQIYGPVIDEGYEIPAVPIEKMDPQFFRQMVADPTGERAGTIVVDTSQHFLYLVLGNGQAMRYGVGLGREGFLWTGHAKVQWKQKWPTWTPPNEMIARQPELAKYSAKNGGMQPGLTNPLGARAMYIFKDGKDTLYRLHGSPEWWSIGKSVSSGCVRLINQDVIDLYSRVRPGSPIWVTPSLGVV